MNRVEKKNAIFFRTVIAATLVVTGLMSAIFWRIKHPEEPKYYQIQNNQGQKQFTSLTPLIHHLFSRESLLLWVEEAVGDIYTFNGINYQQKFNQLLANDFTAAGADSFRKALDDSQLLNQVTTQQLNLTGIVSGQPVILDEGPLMGTYSWKIQMPVLLTFESASAINTKQVIVTVLVDTVPSTESPKEVLISQFWSQ